MRTAIYWVTGLPYGRLAIMPRPRAGDWLEDEIKSLKKSHVDVLVDLLTAPEIQELGLVQEQRLCESNTIQYISFPIKDRGVPPSDTAAGQLLQRLHNYLQDRKSVVIQCRAGIGRSASLAAALFCVAGFTAKEAFAQITRARGLPVPDTTEQRQWVNEIAAKKGTRRR